MTSSIEDNFQLMSPNWLPSSSSLTVDDIDESSRSKLRHIQIIQKRSLLVTGLSDFKPGGSMKIALERFGKFGNISKFVVDPKGIVLPFKVQKENTGVALYLAYATEQQAANAQRELNGSMLCGVEIHTSFVTTRYCHHFLQEKQCCDTDCVLLHEVLKEHVLLHNDTITTSQKSETLKLSPPKLSNVPIKNAWFTKEKALCWGPPHQKLMEHGIEMDHQENSPLVSLGKPNFVNSSPISIATSGSSIASTPGSKSSFRRNVKSNPWVGQSFFVNRPMMTPPPGIISVTKTSGYDHAWDCKLLFGCEDFTADAEARRLDESRDDTKCFRELKIQFPDLDTTEYHESIAHDEPTSPIYGHIMETSHQPLAWLSAEIEIARLSIAKNTSAADVLTESHPKVYSQSEPKHGIIAPPEKKLLPVEKRWDERGLDSPSRANNNVFRRGSVPAKTKSGSGLTRGHNLANTGSPRDHLKLYGTGPPHQPYHRKYQVAQKQWTNPVPDQARSTQAIYNKSYTQRQQKHGHFANKKTTYLYPQVLKRKCGSSYSQNYLSQQ
eukprot:scaffold4235_cov56-Attheya_sp.AAC.4